MEREIFGEAFNSGDSEGRGILGEDRARGWKNVDPGDCPPHILNHIRAVRQAHLEMRTPPAFVPQGSTDKWREDAIKRLSQV